jgi:threonine synthase
VIPLQSAKLQSENLMYVSTRGSGGAVSASRAIVEGISLDGGLYTPAVLPVLSEEEIKVLQDLTFPDRAAYVLQKFLTDYESERLRNFAKRAYASFFHKDVAPVVTLDENTGILELFHGPTSAFKDMALQMLPYLLTGAMEIQGIDEKVCILVATSGDTGKAALEGFADVENTSVVVFYPKDGVSRMQELQMVTQKGDNVGVCAVHGNFDDAQTGVKAILTDAKFANKLAEKKIRLSSANSINWGRLAPQIVYYISAWLDLVKKGTLQQDEAFNICVPTGNFGNILAAYFAKQMGVPVNKLICASNRNNVLTDFIETGVYDKTRPFYQTTSPSMDILISSNVERLLYELSGKNGFEVRTYMNQLASAGQYQVSATLAKALKEHFAAGYCDDAETKATISRTFQKGYLADTHTAVALSVLEEYRRKSNDATYTLVASTASPYKFASSVFEALTGKAPEDDGPALLEALSSLTETAIPAPLSGLDKLPIRFTETVKKDELHRFVGRQLGI